MHWVIQENLYREKGLDDLIDLLGRAGIPYSLHKVIPFVGDIEPDINPPNPVIVFGTYGMRRIAARKGWVPGAFVNDNFEFPIWREHWGDELLNYDAEVCPFGQVPQRDEFFMRPVADSKSFSGGVFGWDEYVDWRTRVADLHEDVGTTLNVDTPVLVCKPREIAREYRLWIVDGVVATASLYRIGGRVHYDEFVDYDCRLYGERIAAMWSPDRAFVLDVALDMEDRYKVVEINCLNAAGLYAANVGKLVLHLEAMGYNDD
jgi:hypothetical protein